MKRRRRGFTLIEVLVALVIVAAGAAAVMAALTSAADSAIFMRERMLANWIAGNRLVEVRLATTPPSNGRQRGDLTYAGDQWSWQQDTSDTQIPGVRRVEISVRRGAQPRSDETAPSWTVTIDGALGRDIARPSGSLPDWEPPAKDQPEDGARRPGTPPGSRPGTAPGAPPSPAPAPAPAAN